MNYPAITPAFIREFEPCYDPSRYLPEDYSASVVEFLEHPAIPPQDKLWMVLRSEVLDDRTLRLFAVWCAREALKLVKNPDPRSVAACDVAEKYANGEATAKELAAAKDAAWDAAWAAARDAARDAAWDAAWAAARDAQTNRLTEMLEDKS